MRERLEREYSSTQTASTMKSDRARGALVASAPSDSELRRDISVRSAASTEMGEEADAEQDLLQEMKDHVRTLSATDDIATLTSNWGAGGDDFDF